jgi:type IV secretion system protein VirB4
MRLVPAPIVRLGAAVVKRAKRVLRAERAGTSAFSGLCDVLGYETLVGDGVLLLKDRFATEGGALLGGFWYRGRDIECSPDEELAGVSQAVNNALKRLDAGWLLHVEAIRMPVHQYTPGEFSEPVDQLIDEERAERARYYRTEFALFVTHAPSFASRTVESGLDKLLGDQGEEELKGLEGRIEVFERKLDELQDALSNGFDEVARMRSRPENDELLQALHLVLNGQWQPIRSPRCPQYIDCLLARDMIGRDGGLWYDEMAVEVVGVQDLPKESTPAFLHALTTLGIDFRWSSRFIVLDYAGSRSRLKSLEGKWLQKVIPLTSQMFGTAGFADRDAQERVEEVQEALADLESGAVRYGHYTTVIVVRGATRAEAKEKAQVAQKALEARGFVAVIESTLRQAAFLGSLPGHGTQNVRKPMIHSLNYADMIPIGREWEGARTCPSPQFPPQSPAHFQARTWSGSAFFGNLFRPGDDVGHTLVTGPTGAGKSTLLGVFASQWMRYEGSQVFCFDQGGSMTALTLARRDGAFYRLGLEGGPELCPLGEIDDVGERAWAETWLAGLCEAQGLAVTTEENQRIRGALKELADETATWTGHERVRRRTLTHLIPHLVDARLQAALSYYTEGAGAVLNGESDALRHARLTTFELEELLGLDKKVVVPTLLYLFRQVERRLDGRPTLLIIDEAWRQLGDPVFAERLRAWLKKLRKKNCAVILATQQLSDVARSHIGDVVFESCPTRFLLPNDLATGSMRSLYADCLGLTDPQIALLAQVERKRWYYYVAGTRSRLFTLDLGPTQVAFCGASSPSELDTIWKLLDAHGERWPEEWLRLRGATRAAERFEVLRSACDERARARRNAA